MNRQQKKIVLNFIFVIAFTLISVIAMIHLKDWVNRSEATRAMTQLSQAVHDYRSAYKSVPPESYIQSILDTLEGRARVSNFNYRARWIDFESRCDAILAFIEQDYHTFIFKKTILILKLDGTVEWIDKSDFQTLYQQQQTPLEKQEASRK